MNHPIVTIKQGKLKGSYQKLLDGSSYCSFKGIPYAQPPVGKLRFKSPLPPLSWPGILEAIEHGPICPQFNPIKSKIKEGNEDCLFLNVYTKTLKSFSKMPVIVFLHSGAYMFGSGNDKIFGPQFLLQHDVILVTVNHRLETLGFLCLEIPEVPGNAGMKDQVAALRWVQENIAQFGGDPNNVTIYGESAGALSVTYHLVSPMSKGLFHQAIAHSGVCIHDYAKGVNARERAFKVGKILGKETNDPYELLEFLQSVPAVKLIGLTSKVSTDDELMRCVPMHFVPVVEKEFKNVESFLAEEPLAIILAKKQNDIPLIIGYNSEDGMIISNHIIENAHILRDNLKFLVPREIAQRLTQSKLDEFGERIRDFYFSKGFLQQDDAVKYSTDYQFSVSIFRFAYFYAVSKQPIYFFKFCIDSELNQYKDYLGIKHVKGTCHVDDLFYIFANKYNKLIYEEKQYAKELIYKMTKLWTDFAKTRNPTPDDNCEVKWPRYTRTKKEYLNINEEFTVDLYPDKDRHEFWDNLYREADMPSFTTA